MTQAKPNNVRNSGQAMTEFVVSVAFVFMVLFVIVPMFGKVQDLQFQNLQASRYVAWERTVWFDKVDLNNDNQDDFVISSDEFESVATRSDGELMESLRSRFFRGHGRPALKQITEDDTSVARADVSPIWTYVQSKQSMYGGTELVQGTLAEQDTPSIAYDALRFVDKALSVVQNPLSDFLNVIGNDNEDFLSLEGFDKAGYFSPVIKTQLDIRNSKGSGSGVWDREADGEWGSGIEDAIFQNWDGTLTARSAILAQGWNTQSEEHYQDRSDDLVLSSVFDNVIFDTVIEIAALLEGGRDNSAVGQLDFGAVGIEPMPAVDGQPLEVACDGGYCDFVEEE
ncbi:MAG: hypothetical protein ACSHXK_14550 [Oceanococcus sp.]